MSVSHIIQHERVPAYAWKVFDTLIGSGSLAARAILSTGAALTSSIGAIAARAIKLNARCMISCTR